METIKPRPGVLFVRAYCSTCGQKLMDSNPLTKKQLISLWDKTVIGAVNIPCESCGHKFPNFNINLRIYNSHTHNEHSPAKYIKLPKHRPSPEDLFRDIANKWIEGRPELQKLINTENNGKGTTD